MSSDNDRDLPAVSREASGLEPDAVIHLYKLEHPSLNGKPLYFTPDANIESGSALPIMFGGNKYIPLPSIISGLSRSTDDTSKPTLRISNINNAIGIFLDDNDDLIGGEIVYIKTYAKFLNTAAEIGQTPQRFVIEKKEEHNAQFIEFSLSSALALPNAILPAGQYFKDHCRRKYVNHLGVRPDDDEYVCPYASDSDFFDENDVRTDRSKDKCSKTIRGCVARFGESVPLPTWATPGTGSPR